MICGRERRGRGHGKTQQVRVLAVVVRLCFFSQDAQQRETISRSQKNSHHRGSRRRHQRRRVPHTERAPVAGQEGEVGTEQVVLGTAPENSARATARSGDPPQQEHGSCTGGTAGLTTSTTGFPSPRSQRAKAHALMFKFIVDPSRSILLVTTPPL